MIEIGMMESFEREVEEDYHRDEYNKRVYECIEYIAKTAKSFGIFDSEKYEAAVKYYQEHEKNLEYVYVENTPIGDFVYGVKKQIKEMHQSKMGGKK